MFFFLFGFFLLSFALDFRSVLCFFRNTVTQYTHKRTPQNEIEREEAEGKEKGKREEERKKENSFH